MIFHSYTGYGVDRRALRLMQWGIGTFLIAVPIDIINHRINGLDITSWSPSHGLLYLGTAIMLAGALRGWWLYAAPGRIRDLVSLGLWLFFVENALFPNQHQEYGVLSLRDYDAGHTTAEPQLLDFAAAQGSSPREFMLPVPSWVHPTWLVFAGLLGLLIARKVVGLRWTATTVAGAYLVYRAVAWLGPGRRRLPALGAAAGAAGRGRAGRPGGDPARARLARRPARRRPRVRRRARRRTSSACCRRGTGGRRCRSRSASAVLWALVDLVEPQRAGWPAGASRWSRGAV